MALQDFTFPGKLGTTNLTAPVNEAQLRELHIDAVKKSAEKRLWDDSLVAKYFPKRLLTGTSTTRIDAMGSGNGIQKLEHDRTPVPTQYKFGVSKFSIDTPVLARARIEELADIQSHLPVLTEIGDDQGRQLAEFIDRTYMIMATKAALMTTTPFQGLSAAEGFLGGTQVSAGTQADSRDPAKLLNAFRQLELAMFKKKVQMTKESALLVVTPEVFYTLESNNMLVDRQIKWSDGTMLNARVLHFLGIPVERSNVFPGGENVQNHLLSNSSNNNAYDGDFTKVLGTVICTKALQDAYAYQPKYSLDWDFKDICHYITTRVAMGVGIARPEFAGVITHA